MTSPENEVYTRLKAAILAQSPNANTASLYVHSPPSFPHVSIELSDTSDFIQAMSSADEAMDEVMFTINIYSNLGAGKQDECRKILRAIDAEMYQMNFTRISAIPVPNMQDATIYRLTARYRAVTDGTYFYRR